MKTGQRSRMLLPLLLLSLCGTAEAEGGPVVVYQAAADYEFVVEGVKEAIINRGMTVSGTLHVSDMLARTAADLGYAASPYLKAESIEFCSAALSQRMVRADPRNLVICPFTVAVYVPAGEPDRVHVAFRRHRLAGVARDEERAVFDLLDGIAREAAE